MYNHTKKVEYIEEWKPKKTKSPKSTCDLCCDNIESDQDQLACEGWLWLYIVHRYCAGVPTKRYANCLVYFVCLLLLLPKSFQDHG